MPSTTSSHGSEEHRQPSERLTAALGHRFEDDDLLQLALNHRSWCAENGDAESNERLEFLGDSVLGVAITDHLYNRCPGDPEGVLARRRAELVSTVALAEVARELDLGAEVHLGRGEEATGGRDKPSILADTMEAVIGAVYLDGGMARVTETVLGLFGGRITDVCAAEFFSDHKSRLQEVAARHFGELPHYDLAGSGPEHEKSFIAIVRVDGTVLGRGEGRTKKEAEQNAAAVAHRHLVESTDGRGSTVATNGEQDA